MGSWIVIDGYNVIRQSGPLLDLEAVALEEGRRGLIQLLAAYKKTSGHAITVVFDGWQSDNIGTSGEKIQGIDIVYSGRGEKADDIMKRMVDQLGDRVVVVTSDREIVRHAEKRGAVAIPSHEFEMKVRMCVSVVDGGNFIEEEKEEQRTGTRKKGPSRRLSKAERKKKSKMEKL